MAPNIMGDQAFVSYRMPGWHQLGITKQDHFKFVEVLPEAGMDYTIIKRPMGAVMPDNTIYSVPDKFVLMRSPCSASADWAALGECSGRYDYFQNGEIASLMDDMSDQTGWNQETIGALGNGADIFLTLNSGIHTVAGEDVNLYTAYVSKRNGKEADYILTTGTRIECQNTLGIAMRNNAAKIVMQHSNTLRDEAAWRLDMISQAKKNGEDFLTAMRKLEAIKVTEDAFSELAEVIFPMPKVPVDSANLRSSNRTSLMDKADRLEYVYNRSVMIAQNAKQMLAINYEKLNDEFPAIAGTGWAAYQAVTEYTTHQMGGIGGDETRRGRKASTEVRAKEDMIGEGLEIRTRAYQEIVKHK